MRRDGKRGDEKNRKRKEKRRDKRKKKRRKKKREKRREEKRREEREDTCCPPAPSYQQSGNKNQKMLKQCKLLKKKFTDLMCGAPLGRTTLGALVRSVGVHHFLQFVHHQPTTKKG